MQGSVKGEGVLKSIRQEGKRKSAGLKRGGRYKFNGGKKGEANGERNG